MIRPQFCTAARTFLSIAVTGLTILSACGEQTKQADITSRRYAMALVMTDAGTLVTDGNSTNGDHCATYIDAIHEGRKAVAATDEWKAFEATDEWQQVKTDGVALKKIGCKHHDPAPPLVCTQIIDHLKTHFEAAQQTDEYKACEELQVWKDLKKSYDEAREANCLPSQQEEAEQSTED